MTALIIIGIILSIVLIIALIPVTITIVAEKNAYMRVSWAFITLYKSDSKKKKKPKRKKKDKPTQAQHKKIQQKPGKQANSDKSGKSDPSGSSDQSADSKVKENKLSKLDLGDLPSLLRAAGKPIKRLLLRLYVTDLYIDSVVGSEDAAMTAIKYGVQCTLIDTALHALKEYVRVDVKDVVVEADFSQEKDDFFLHCKIKARTYALAALAVSAVFVIMKGQSHGKPKQHDDRLNGQNQGNGGRQHRDRRTHSH
jgi:hypothetical protein